MRGIASDPSAMPAMSALSTAPKTRPITSSDTRRCMIVKALMSTSEFPRPRIAITSKTGPRLGQATISSRGADQRMHADAEVDGQAPSGGEHEGDEAAHQPADAHHGVERAHAWTRPC